MSSGKIVQIIGAVIDVEFPRDAMPRVFDALTVDGTLLGGPDPRTILGLESPEQIVIFSLDRAYRYTAFNENHRRTMKQIWGRDIALGSLGSDGEGVGPADQRHIFETEDIVAAAAGGKLDPVLVDHANLFRRQGGAHPAGEGDGLLGDGVPVGRLLDGDHRQGGTQPVYRLLFR